MRWLTRLIGLVNVAILARLLAPSDFGLIAMVSLVIGFVEIWLSLGTANALIQSQGESDDYLNTAWTLRVLQTIGIVTILVLAAPIAGWYFNEPRVVPLIWVVSFGVLIAGFGNIGVVLFERELHFHKEFSLNLSTKLISLFLTISLAFWLQDYWALAYGMVGSSIIATIASYVWHPYRPWFGLAKWRELWEFSKWNFVGNVVGYFESRADELIVGRARTSEDLGIYSLSSEFGRLATAEISQPANRVLFPSYARLKVTPDRLANAFLNSQALIALIIIPSGVGLCLVADEAVRLVFGTQWLAAVPLVKIFALYGVVKSLGGAGGVLLSGIGRPRVPAIIHAVALLMFVALASVMLRTEFTMESVASARGITAVVVAMLLLGFVTRNTQVTWISMLQSLWRPVLGVLAMVLVLPTLPLNEVSVLAALIIKVACGAALYVAVVLVLWILAGRSEGPERLIVATLLSRVRSVSEARSRE